MTEKTHVTAETLNFIMTLTKKLPDVTDLDKTHT